jgi:hypothetical protein
MNRQLQRERHMTQQDQSDSDAPQKINRLKSVSSLDHDKVYAVAMVSTKINAPENCLRSRTCLI